MSTPSFIHTSAFSLPVVPLSEEEEESTLVLPPEPKDDLELLLSQALASCAQLAYSNAQLDTENKRLLDKLVIFQELLAADITDTNVLDSSIAMLRGKLLEESRVENQSLREEAGELKGKSIITRSQ
jgi:hypothetical protein